MRKCREKLKVAIIVAMPRIERIEAQRSTMVRVRICETESDVDICVRLENLQCPSKG